MCFTSTSSLFPCHTKGAIKLVCNELLILNGGLKAHKHIAQGARLGYVLLPFQGVPIVS